MEIERILFSPLGDTDPIRNCYDGACLHIVRHYHPSKVVLFYTKDMEEKERRDHRYTRAIHRLQPELPIQEIFSEIEDPHHFDAFNTILPEKMAKLRELYPEAQILINLSSGTPQMKTLMAILSIEFPNCLGIQVESPSHASNRTHSATQDEEDINALLENNFDDEEGAENRCIEPKLRVFRYYAEKSRIASLVDAQEFPAALKLSNGCPEITDDAIKLLKHATIRMQLEPEKAKKVLSHYAGVQLFPMKDKQGENLVEYFLLMQQDERAGRLSNLVVRIIPFLYTFMLAYEDKNVCKPLRQLCSKSGGGYRLGRSVLMNEERGFLIYLDQELLHGYRDNDNLSFYNLLLHSEYLQKSGGVKNKELHSSLLEILEQIKDVRDIRNRAAHEMVNITAESFEQKAKISPSEMLNAFWKMLVLLYGKEIVPLRGIYGQIGTWVKELL